MDLLGAPRWQAPAQKGTDLGLADIELLGQDPGVVSVPRKPGLQVVQTGDQYAVDKSRRDGLLCDLMGLFKGQGQVALDLQRGCQALGQQLDGLVADQGLGLVRCALPEEPADVGFLLAVDAVEREDGGACPISSSLGLPMSFLSLG